MLQIAAAIQVAKYAGIALAISTTVLAISTAGWLIYDAGQENERGKWLDKTILANAEIIKTNTENTRLTEESATLALKIEGLKNESDKELEAVRGDLRRSERMYGTAKLCKNRVPETGNTRIPVAPASDDTGISAEFQEFLNAELWRADQLATYVAAGSTWAINVCKTEQVVCETR